MGLFDKVRDAFSNVTEDVEPDYQEYEFQDSTFHASNLSEADNDNTIRDTNSLESSTSDAVSGVDDGYVPSDVVGVESLEPVSEDKSGGGDERVVSDVSEVRNEGSTDKVAPGEGDEYALSGSIVVGSLESSDEPRVELVQGDYVEEGVIGDTDNVLDPGFEFDEVEDPVSEDISLADATDTSGERLLESDVEVGDGSDDDDDASLGFNANAEEGDEESEDDLIVELDSAPIDLSSHRLGDYRSESLRPAAVVDAGSSVVGSVVESDVFEQGVVTSAGQDVTVGDSATVEDSENTDSLDAVEDGAGEDDQSVSTSEERLGEDSSGSSVVSRKWTARKA